MKRITIIQCTDSMLWYAKMIGQEVEFLGEEDMMYWSRDRGGYKNIVWKKDARLSLDEQSKQENVTIAILNHKIEVLSGEVKRLTERVALMEKARANNNPLTYTVPPWTIHYSEPALQPPWKVTSQSGN